MPHTVCTVIHKISRRIIEGVHPTTSVISHWICEYFMSLWSWLRGGWNLWISLPATPLSTKLDRTPPIKRPGYANARIKIQPITRNLHCDCFTDSQLFIAGLRKPFNNFFSYAFSFGWQPNKMFTCLCEQDVHTRASVVKQHKLVESRTVTVTVCGWEGNRWPCEHGCMRDQCQWVEVWLLEDGSQHQLHGSQRLITFTGLLYSIKQYHNQS